MAKNMLTYYLLGIIKLLIAIMGGLVNVINGLDGKGFINLDCGLPNGASYNLTDDNIGYIYTSDHEYIESGEIKNVSSEFSSSPTLFRTLRFFPTYKRNCYSLLLPAVTEGSRYLVRASFMYGNYDARDLSPSFDLYLGVDKWYTVKLDNSSHTLWTEIITTANGTSLSVCLVRTAGGVPFISALELRPLQDEFLNRTSWLVTYQRVNVGSSGPSRFRDDPYDRIWSPDYSGFGTPISTNASIGNDRKFAVPSGVLQTADYSSTSIDINWPINDGDRVYFALHFSGLLQLENNQPDNITIYFKDRGSYNLSIDYGSWDYVCTSEPLQWQQYSMSIIASNGSSQPIISGFEVYKTYQPTFLTSSADDVDALTEIKKVYFLKKNWLGDPCLPESYPWDGLTCKYNNVATPRIISLDLSNNGLSGPISPFMAKLTALQSLNLSRNSLSGEIPGDLALITTLTSIDLSCNNLSGKVPEALLQRVKDKLLDLRLDGNPLQSTSDSGHDNREAKDRKKKMLIIMICIVVPAIALLLFVLVTCTIFAQNKRYKLPQTSELEQCETSRTLELTNGKHVFTYADVSRITKHFSCVIGKGGSGIVYYGSLENSCDVAVKKLTKSHFQGEKEFVTEVKTLMNVHHKNLVSFIGYCTEANSMILIYEYTPHGNLQQLLAGKNNGLSWEKRLQIALSVATGLEYLHVGCRPPIIHRDIKTSNILLDVNWEAKVADFGLSKAINSEDASYVTTVVAGTRGYIDPEYCSTGKLTEKSDVYSFGVILFELITGLPVFHAGEKGQQVYVVQWAKTLISRGDLNNSVDPRLEDHYSSESMWKVIELAMACTSALGSERPTMSEIVSEVRGAKDVEACTCGTTSSSAIERASAVDNSATYTAYVESRVEPVAR